MSPNGQTINPDDYLDDSDYSVPVRYHKRKKTKQDRSQVVPVLAEAGDDSRQGFSPTFTGSRHERQWIKTFLGPFYEDQMIMDVLRHVKGGKEATVYCCRASPPMGVDLVAAKVYRPRAFRNLRNDAVYRQGREVVGNEGKEVRGRRERLAMKKGTDYGQKLRHTTWLANEFETLERLANAGADVPKPYASTDNAILMEYLGEEQFAAPTLHQVSLAPRQAHAIFELLIHNVELMLAHDRIHADLSAYNVLYWKGKIRIIDFPQAVDPIANPQARELLVRDVQRICQYFAQYGIKTDGGALAQDMWERYILHSKG